MAVHLSKTRITFGRRTVLLFRLLAVVAVVQLTLLVITNIELIHLWGKDWHTTWLVHVKQDAIDPNPSNLSLESPKRLVDSNSPEVMDFEYSFPSDKIAPSGFVWHATNTWELCSALVSLYRTKSMVNTSSSRPIEYLLRLHLFQNDLTPEVGSKVGQLLKKWTKAGGRFRTKNRNLGKLITKSEVDLSLKVGALEHDLRSVVILDPFAIPMKPLEHLLSDRTISSVMIMAPKGKASKPISTALIVSELSRLMDERVKIGKVKKLGQKWASPPTPTEFFNHEFACNDEIGLLPEKIMFEDVKDRESKVFDNAELFLFNSKHKPWTEKYRPIFDSLPPKAKQFVKDWRKETYQVCNGHEGLFTDLEEKMDQSTMPMESDNSEMTIPKRGPKLMTNKRRYRRLRRNRELKSI